MQTAPSSAAKHFCALLARIDPQAPPLLLQLAAALIDSSAAGNLCLDLPQLALANGSPLPPLAEVAPLLLASPLVGRPGERAPLLLDDGGRLYLYRNFAAEEALAAALLQRAVAVRGDLDEDLLQAGLARLFPEGGEQALAAATALRKPFAVICGGPGTGKTTTVVKVLALLIEQYGPLRIALTAPTGKAAARLREAVNRARESLAVEAAVKAAIPTEALTLHRLLGATPRPGSFRHDAAHLLPVDLVVLDEASMADLGLMRALLAALPEAAGLLILGDRDQLASVEAGAVLADLTAVPAQSAAALAASIATLRQSRRFAGGSAIASLCGYVNAGQSAEALALLAAGDPSAGWQALPPSAGLATALAESVCPWVADYLAAPTPAEALASFGRFMILTALRQGPYGSPALNRTITELLQRRRLVERGEWYAGRPVMIVRNAPADDLFNGDLGLTCVDPASGELRVFFPTPEGTVRAISPLRLPEHETAFALTVHKSQGSEFERILLILPPQRSEILSRELIYTALSRARASLTVWGREEVFSAALSRRIERSSGLRERLWGEG